MPMPRTFRVTRDVQVDEYLTVRAGILVYEHTAPRRTEAPAGHLAVTYEPDGRGPAIPLPADALEET